MCCHCGEFSLCPALPFLLIFSSPLSCSSTPFLQWLSVLGPQVFMGGVVVTGSGGVTTYNESAFGVQQKAAGTSPFPVNFCLSFQLLEKHECLSDVLFTFFDTLQNILPCTNYFSSYVGAHMHLTYSYIRNSSQRKMKYKIFNAGNKFDSICRQDT